MCLSTIIVLNCFMVYEHHVLKWQVKAIQQQRVILFCSFFFQMASKSNSTISHSSLVVDQTSNSEVSKILITINVAFQTPLKLTPSNYNDKKIKYNIVLVGYDILGHVDGSLSCLSTSLHDGKFILECSFWIRQKQLILNAIVTSISPLLVSFIGNCKTSKSAWVKYNTMYEKSSKGHLMTIRDDLSHISKGTKSITYYMQLIQSHVDEIVMFDSPIHHE